MPLTYLCYLCSEKLVLTEAVNYQGHWVHATCGNAHRLARMEEKVLIAAAPTLPVCDICGYPIQTMFRSVEFRGKTVHDACAHARVLAEEVSPGPPSGPVPDLRCGICQEPVSLDDSDARLFRGALCHDRCLTTFAQGGGGVDPAVPGTDKTVAGVTAVSPATPAADDGGIHNTPTPAMCGQHGCVKETGHQGPCMAWGENKDWMVTPTHVTERIPATEMDPGHPSDAVSKFTMHIPRELMQGPDSVAILQEIHEIAVLLLTKNRAYGSSFRKPMGVFSKLPPVEAIRVRMDDKLARIQQAKDFSEDTHQDLIGYLILERLALKLKEKQ